MLPALRIVSVKLRDLLRKFDVELSRCSTSALHGRLKALIEQQEIDCVLDVGANTGQFAEFLRTVGYRGNIVSFEPAAAPFRILKEKSVAAEKKKVHGMWLAQQVGLGSREEERILNVAKAGTLSSLYESNEYGRERFPEEVLDHQESIRITRLDKLYPSLQQTTCAKNIFLKIDTQGHDLEVFRGALECHSQLRLLMMELSVSPIYDEIPDWQSVMQEVQDAGFSLAGLFAINYGRSGEVIEFDGLFVSKTIHP